MSQALAEKDIKVEGEGNFEDLNFHK